jgi:hypothetical protein
LDRFRHRAIIALEAAPGGLGKQTHRPTILKGGFGPPFLQADGSFPRAERHKEIVVLPFSRFRQAGHEDRCRPPPPVAAGNGAGGEGAWSVGSERAVTPRGECPKIPLSSIRSGACRHEGWHATRACFFTPKACQYPPFARMTRLANPAGGVSSNIPSITPKHLGCLFCATKTAENRRDVRRADPKTPGLNSRPYWPGGRRMGAGRSRVSVRRAVQVLSGLVIRQRTRVGSSAVIPRLA